MKREINRPETYAVCAFMACSAGVVTTINSHLKCRGRLTSKSIVYDCLSPLSHDFPCNRKSLTAPARPDTLKRIIYVCFTRPRTSTRIHLNNSHFHVQTTRSLVPHRRLCAVVPDYFSTGSAEMSVYCNTCCCRTLCNTIENNVGEAITVDGKRY